jgi:hypothetical protein
MRRMRFVFERLLFAERLFLDGFSGKRNGRITLLVDQIKDAPDCHRIAGPHFFQRDLKSHALDKVRTILKLSGKILSKCLLIAPDVASNSSLRPTGGPEEANKLLIFLALSKRWPTTSIFDRFDWLPEKVNCASAVGNIVCHGIKNL